MARIGTLAAALLLAACSVARPPVAVESPAAGADRWMQRSLEQPGLQRWLRARGASHAPGQAWSERQLRLAALYFHPDQALARAGVQLAQADLRMAGQWPNPRLQLALKYQATQAVALPSPWTLGAAISLLLWSREQRQAQQQRARAGLRAARALLDASAWDLRRRVDAAFIGVWQSRRALGLQRQALDIAQRRMRLLAARERQGWASPWSVDLARERLQRRQRELVDARARVEASRVELAAAVGVPAQALSGQALDLRALDAVGADAFQLPAADSTVRALQRRADVLAAWQGVRAARAELLRQLSLRDGAPPRVAPGVERDQGATDLTLGADLPLPLFNHHEGQIDAARAREARARARLLQVQARVAGDIEQARAALRAADAAWGPAQASWLRADQAWTAASAAPARPWIDPLQLERVRERWVRARLQRLQVRAAQWRALAGLRAALQGAAAPAPMTPTNPETSS